MRHAILSTGCASMNLCKGSMRSCMKKTTLVLRIELIEMTAKLFKSLLQATVGLLLQS